MSAPWGAINQTEGAVANLVSGRRDTFEMEEQYPAQLLQNTSSDDESENERAEKVTNLARVCTQQSIKKDGTYVNPFENSEDPLLNPHSGSFSQRAWIKTLIGIASRDPERYPQRVAGVAFKNLNVHGFGKNTDYQKTFGNYPLEINGIFNRFRGGDNGKTKIQILRNFDGLVKSGEMLVVLGRPGR
jgi:ATP-binding cassette subfamily G (WHITE) protein 2 (PDR)